MAINENDSRVRRTKKLIRKGLMELAQEKSIDKISVKELTDRIDINRGTFYLHYSDIDGLVQCIQNEVCDSFRQIMSDVNSERMRQEPVEIFFEVCNFIKQNSDVCSVLLVADRTSVFAAETGRLLGEKCYEIVSEAYPDLSAEKYDLICEYFKYGGIGIIRSWLNSHPDQTPRQIAELWFNMAKGGILNILQKEVSQK